MDGVVRVIPNHMMQLHTTRSWDFLGFSQSSVGPNLEGDVVIGLIDTGKYVMALSLIYQVISWGS